MLMLTLFHDEMIPIILSRFCPILPLTCPCINTRWYFYNSCICVWPNPVNYMKVSYFDEPPQEVYMGLGCWVDGYEHHWTYHWMMERQYSCSMDMEYHDSICADEDCTSSTWHLACHSSIGPLLQVCRCKHKSAVPPYHPSAKNAHRLSFYRVVNNSLIAMKGHSALNYLIQVPLLCMEFLYN